MSQAIDIAIVVAAVLVACLYLARLTWRRWRAKASGCGCGPSKPKRTTLTLGGKPVK